MKRTLLFITCMMTSMMMFAQEGTNDYLPFVELGKKWHVVIVSNPNYVHSAGKYWMCNEVERNGKTYIYTYLPYDEIDVVEEVGLLREENRRVYKYDEASGRDIMLYDFSLNEGDTFIYEYGLDHPVNCKVLKQGCLEDGPKIVSSYSTTSEGTTDVKYRKLRTWTIGCDDGTGDYHEVATWVEGVGALKNMFHSPFMDGVMFCLSYVERKPSIDNWSTPFWKNEYLPFSFCTIFDMFGQIHGCNLPTGREDNEQRGNPKRGHQLTYELEGDRLHVYGNVYSQCGPFNYAYFYEKSTDNQLVRKIEFEIQEVEPVADCMGLHTTDFYVPGFDPNMNYIVVDNYGEEHTVIKKTKHFPEGTKWTEIRLDTLKYDSWYSKVGNEWVPNFETIEYYVDGNYSDRDMTFRKVFTNGPEWTDSLTLLIQEADNTISVSPWVHNYEGTSGSLWPGEIYQFDWNVGKGLYYEDILLSNTTTEYPYHYYYGIIDEIKEGQFGGVRPLKYVDLDGKAPVNPQEPGNRDTNGGRIIQGIGVTEWNDGECLFGPPAPYHALSMYDNYQHPERHYRSMLVHFERNGEVLYDMMPDILPQNEYRPFVEDGKVWTVKVYPDGYGMVRNDTWTEYYYFNDYTNVGGKTCKRMMYVTNANEDNWVNGVFTPGNLPQHYIGAWYEQDNKVYYAANGKQEPELLYDFTLSTGDNITNPSDYNLIVNKVSGDIPGFKGTYYEMWMENISVERWLEGVGSESWPYLNHPWGHCGHVGVLLSCRVGNEVIYYNSEMDDPYEMGAQKRRFDFTHTTKLQPKVPTRRGEEQSLYGEYNALQLGINLEPIADAYMVRITDETGKVVYEKAINAGSIVGLNIDISNYPKGRYTVTVENSQEVFTGEFEAQATGIEEVNLTPVLSKGEGTIFNLQGQRISSLQKGLNIVNRQKVFVK